MLCKRDLHRWMNNILTGFFVIIFFSQFSSLVYGERSGQKIFMGAVVCSLNLAPYCLCLFILIQPRLDFEKLPKNYQKTRAQYLRGQTVECLEWECWKEGSSIYSALRLLVVVMDTPDYHQNNAYQTFTTTAVQLSINNILNINSISFEEITIDANPNLILRGNKCQKLCSNPIVSG